LRLWSAEPGKPAAAAMQATYPLNPNNFTSLGASPFTSAGTYTIDASRNNAHPILTKPDNTMISGVFFTSSGGEIAVFTFDSNNIPANVTVAGARNANWDTQSLFHRIAWLHRDNVSSGKTMQKR
jgi:hypothetical protein